MDAFAAIFCDHTQISSCCEPECGHYSCPCGLSWDDGFSSPFDEDFLEDFTVAPVAPAVEEHAPQEEETEE